MTSPTTPPPPPPKPSKSPKTGPTAGGPIEPKPLEPMSQAGPSTGAPPRKPVPTLFWILLGLSALILIATVLMVFSPFQEADKPPTAPDIVSSSTPREFKAPPGDKILLLVGVDVDYDNIGERGTRADTIMLVRISQARKSVSVVSIPRDSKVFYPPNRGVGKINGANAIGGVEYLVKTVENAFGIPINNYVVMNLAGIEAIIDQLDGIDVYVEKRLRYRDRTAKLNIDLEPGTHHLTGKEAVGYLRFRHDALGDIGRIRRQQQFLSAMSEKLHDPWMIAKIPGLVDVTNQHVKTNLDMGDLFRIAWFMKSMNMEKVRVATLPGYPASEGGISYWIVDAKNSQDILDRLILESKQDPKANRTPKELADEILKVGVVYAPEIASEIPDLENTLTEKGFRVVCKTSRTQTNTHIVEHTQRITDGSTRRLRSVDPRLKNLRLIFAPVGTTFENNMCSGQEDYTLILGAEFQ